MTRQKVSIGNYGNYSSDNYGSSRYVNIGNLTLYFSYDTVIAFTTPGVLVIRENDWKTTTGKHLNAIDRDKSKRISSDEFEAKLDEVLKKHGFEI